MEAISVYELLGMVKDDKAPNKIMYNNIIWEYIEHERDYRSRHNAELFFNDEINNSWITKNLNTKIEIIEENKKIEKIIPTSLIGIDNLDEKIEVVHIDTINAIDKINKIIKVLNEMREDK